jgi:beta-phosphoglucomutase-like phosphatase (HAD superfamily)
LFDDAMGFLSCVQIPVCIVSDIDRADLEAAIDHHRLTFARVVTGEDVRSYKPRPEPFERALELLGVPVTGCCTLETRWRVTWPGRTGPASRWPGSTGPASGGHPM